MVLETANHAQDTATRHSSRVRNIDTAARPPTAPSDGGIASPLGLQNLRNISLRQGFSATTAEVMAQSKRLSTHRQYNTYITQCQQRNIEPSDSDVRAAIEFLDNLRRTRNLGYMH